MLSRFFHRFQAITGPARRVLIGQLLLCSGLLLTGVVLAMSGNRRAGLLMALVPIIFVPFAYARVQLHRVLERRLPRRGIDLITGCGLVFDVVMAVQLLTSRDSGTAGMLHTAGVTWIGAVWFSAHAVFLLGWLVTGAARLGTRPLRRRRTQVNANVTSDGPVVGRRELLQRAGLAGAALPFGVSLSGVPISYDFRVEEREIVLPHWPPVLDGFRIAHLSDIHVGGSMDRNRLQQVADLTNAAGPDMVLYTGDFLTHRLGDFDAPLYPALAQIQAPSGQWACLGNHDFDDVERFVGRLRDCGVTTLRNRLVPITVRGHEVELAGIDFIFDQLHRAEIYADIIRSWGPRRTVPRILLSHDPTGFGQLPTDCADLVLSGHTHGGHIGLQLGTSRALTVVGLAGFPDQGIFRRGAMQMYVTRCVGFYGYPMRLGIPPEIALLTLRGPRRQDGA